MILVVGPAIRSNLSQDSFHGLVAITTHFSNPALIVLVPRKAQITLRLMPSQNSAKFLWVDSALTGHLDRRDHGHLAASF
jgi:hypothetical protein